ncbi:MAG: fluoride efflux transporter FluC [Micrococcales bacterium]
MSNPSFFIAVLGVALLGGAGSVVRLVLSHWHGRLPWGILVGNTVASVVVGYMFPISQSGAQGSVFTATLIATGFAGGLSTFSSWTAQTMHLMVEKQPRLGYLNFVLNMALPVVGALVGMLVSMQLLK